MKKYDRLAASFSRSKKKYLDALNRRRFKKRIRSIAQKIEWCLKPEHRDTVSR